MKNITAKVTHTPILYNGKRYEVGSVISVPETEYPNMKYYLSEPLSDDNVAKTEAKQIADELEQADAEPKTNEAEPKNGKK